MKHSRYSRYSAAVLAACCFFAAGCKVLSAPQSDDGGLKGGQNTSPSVSYQISNPNPKVGESVVVTVTANGQPVPTNTGSTVTSSDQGVLFGVAAAYRAVAVGKSTISISYSSYFQSQVVNVSPSADGMAAYVYLQGNVFSGLSFGPRAVSVKAGSSVEFKLPDTTHNITFDGTPGAPANVAVGTSSTPSMVFGTAGVFAYQCTLHGETGTITVVP